MFVFKIHQNKITSTRGEITGNKQDARSNILVDSVEQKITRPWKQNTVLFFVT